MSSGNAVNNSNKSRVVIITLPLVRKSENADHAISNVAKEEAVIPVAKKERFFGHVKEVQAPFYHSPSLGSKYGGLGYHIDSAPRNHLVVRKRQKLTHLTPQEKLNRRKFKNRLAAHLARERRKKFVLDLERRYKRLKFEHQELKARNMQIKQDIDRLNIENDMIKKQLSETTVYTQPYSTSIAETSTSDVTSSTPSFQTSSSSSLSSSLASATESFGSAVSINEPLQQGRVFRQRSQDAGKTQPAASSLTAWLLTLTMMASTTTAATDRCDFYEQSFQNVQGILERWALTSRKHQRWAQAVLEKMRSRTWDKEAKKQMMAKLLTYVQRRLLDDGTRANAG